MRHSAGLPSSHLMKPSDAETGCIIMRVPSGTSILSKPRTKPPSLNLRGSPSTLDQWPHRARRSLRFLQFQSSLFLSFCYLV